MSGMRISLALLGMHKWFGGDHTKVAELVALADRKGVDQVTVVDHVVMGEHVEAYPFGKFQGSPSSDWLEPLVELGVYAGMTKRIRLSAGIVITPLRPAALLAKQLATLDVLSRGRVEIGVGVGWQKEEYDACGVPWKGRFGLMHEQMRACRLLWTQEPATFKGKRVAFERIYCKPFPVQKGGIPIYYGVAASELNIERMAELADGWLPIDTDPVKIKEPVRRIRAALEARGRDAARFDVRASPLRVRTQAHVADLDAMLRSIPQYADAGVTTLRIQVADYCPGPDEYEHVIERLVAGARG